PRAATGGPLAAPAALLAAPCGPLTAPCCCLPCALRCPASPRSACCATMASLSVLAFDHEGSPLQFDMWLDDLQLYLLSDSRDSVSLFDHTSGAAPAPPATANSATHSQWLTAPCLAIPNHLPLTECAHFGQHWHCMTLSSFTTPRLPLLLYAASYCPTCSSSCPPLPQSRTWFPTFALATLATALPPQLNVPSAEDVGDASASAKRRSNKGKGGRDGGGGSGNGGGGSSGGSGGSGGGGSGGSGGGSGGFGGGGGGSGGSGGSGSGGSGGGRTGAQCGGSGGGQRQRQQRRSETPSPQHLREWLFRRGASGGNVSCPAEGDYYRCVPLDPGIKAAALGANESSLPGTAPAEALQTFTLDAGSSSCFFCDSTTLTPLPAPVSVRLTDPSGGPVVARSYTVLPCPAVPSGSVRSSPPLVLYELGEYRCPPGFDGHYHHSWGSACVDLHVYTDRSSPGHVHSSARFETVQTGYRASSDRFAAHFSASGQVAPPYSCRLLSRQTLLSHHRLGHPSLPRLHGMHPRLLVSGLPTSLPPLPPSPASPCLPCVEGRKHAAPHSSFPPTTAPLQTLHMDVWGPTRVSGQGRECYFLLVIDDYTRHTTVFSLHRKGQVLDVLIPWIRAVRLQLRERFHQDLPVLRLHSDKGGEFSSDLLRDICRGKGILQSFTLAASPQQNRITERCIGLVMEVARTSMIHAAAPHFLWPFAVWYATHQLNLWPCVSLSETSPTVRWTGEVGDASVFRVWGSHAFVRDSSAEKLSARAIPFVFLGSPLDVPSWQFYHPTSRRVFPSQDVTFDDSVPVYCLFPYRSAPPPPLPLFLAPGPPPVDPLPSQGPSPSGLSQVDPLPGTVPVEVDGDSGAARGNVSGGAASGGAEPGGAESEGAGSGGFEPGGAEPVGAKPSGVEPGGAEPEGVEPRGAESEGAESGGAKPWATGDTGAGGVGVPAGAGGTGGTASAGPRGARTRESGAAGTGGVGGARAGDPTEPRAAGAGGTCAGCAGAGGAGAGGTGAGGAGAGGAGAVDPGAGGAGARGAVSGGTSAGGTLRPRAYFVPLLQHVLGVPSSNSLTPPLLCPPPDQSQPPLQPAPPQPTPSPYTEQSGGLTERCEPAFRLVLPVRTAHRVPRSRPPPVPGTHAMAVRPSSVPLRVPLLPPPESSLRAVPDLASDLARAANPTVSRLLATVVTDPSFESTTASAPVVELLEFSAASRLDYATALVAASGSASPPSVGGECALGTNILEDRQEDFECLTAAVPRFASMLLAPEGDPDAPDIPTPRSYAEAITGPYSSQWQAAMDAEMASWKSTGTYVDAIPPTRANIVDGMWIFRVKRPPGSPPAFKARYIARGFSLQQGVDYFQTFSPTPKMTTLWVLLHVAAQPDYELHSLDFCTTFLQAVEEGMGVVGVANLLSPEQLLHRPFSYLTPAAGAAVGGRGSAAPAPPPTPPPSPPSPAAGAAVGGGYGGCGCNCGVAGVGATAGWRGGGTVGGGGAEVAVVSPASPVIRRLQSPVAQRACCASRPWVRCSCRSELAAEPITPVVWGYGPASILTLLVLRLHSDRGGEFSYDLLRDFCRREGITQSFTLPEYPQQNGIAEHRIGLDMEVARTSMIHAATPHILWPFAIRYAAHHLNLWPRVSLPETSPKLRWTGKVGDASVFRFYHPTSCRVLLSKDVTFDESVPFHRVFPYRSTPPPPLPLFLAPGPPPVDPLPPQGAASWDTVRPRPYFVPLLQQVLGAPSTGLPPPYLCSPPDQSQPPLQPTSPLPAPSPYTEQSGGLTERREPASRPVSPVRTARRAPRSRRPPVPGTHTMALPRATNPTVARLLATAVTDPSFECAAASALIAELLDFAAACRLDYASSLVAESVPASPPFVGGECALGSDVLEDRQEDFECLAAAVPRFASLLLAPEGDPDAPDIPTPRSYSEAITGTYVDKVPPPGASRVDGMWIFRVKRPPGSPPAFKARYVARGFSQRQGVDFFQTFSPTPKMTTLRVMLHVAAQRDYELHSLDFSTAFLQGSVHEEIWLRQPPGFTGTFPAGTQWSLRRPVYSLRQALREWHDTLRTTLAALGFAPAIADPSLFLRIDTSLPPFYVLVYVDDVVFATADTEALTLVLERFGFQYSSPQLTPLSTSHSLSAPPSDESVEPSGLYPELVGCLMYLMTCTRPDLAYPLSLLARYVAPSRHRKVHWDAAKRVLRYLCSTSGMGLVLGGRGPLLTGHADASWVDDSVTQRSSQGYTFSLGSGSVSWRSTHSSSVLSSSCEAEIYAGAMASLELRWLTYLLTDLGEQPRSPPVLYVDNKAMIALCLEHILEHRTKHIALRYFLA
ncbi:unnamed protein product, partial [Closterium sp. NIES-54]